MARPRRFEYPGAVYHVMARGDGGKAVFETDDDRKVFLARLGEVCGSRGWRVHAWVLMSNHFHLLLETPEANLVSGMKWLMGTFSQGWNRARMRRGHVFQGRYKAVPVNGSDADLHYFRIVADYIHLNPARAEMAGGRKGPLVGYVWSSLPYYAKGKNPEWMDTERVLRSFELAEDGRGRRAYVAWIEARAADPEGAIGEEAQAALRRGWYLGEETFRDKLLGMIDKAKGVKPSGRKSPQGPMRDHGECEAERLIEVVGTTLGLPADDESLASLRKGDERKALLAAVLRRRTTVGTEWIAQRLHMGHAGSVSRSVLTVVRGEISRKELARLETM